MTTQRLLITGALHKVAQEGFNSYEGLEVDYSPDLPREVLLEKIKDVHVLVTRSETTIDKELIDRAENLKIVGRAAVGVGNIDIPYATEKGILVLNTPGKNTNSAAEMTMTLLMGMLRNFTDANQKMKDGGWDRHTFTGNELRHKKIGLVGIGHVGHRVAKFCHGFDMEVLGYDPYISSNIFQRHNVTKIDSLEELASKVDILSVHVPLNSETKGMVDLDVLNKMPQGGWVVNAARGGVICEQSIVEALNSEHLAAAAVDTFEGEPSPSRNLVDHPRVYVSPHIGASTIEAQKAIGETIVEQIIKAVEGGVVDYPVNLPQVGVVDNPLLKPYTVLAEKLGSFSAQILEFNPTNIEISYRGDLAEQSDHTFIKLGFKKGYVSRAVDTYISYVNADTHFDELGIEVSEAMDPEFTGYRSAIKIKLKGSKGEALTVGGIVFDGEYPRISLVNDFYFEVDPNGEFIVMENDDKPGVIGAVGTYLANNEVNIDSFDLARNKKGGKAMSMIKIDSKLSPENRKAFGKLSHITRSHVVSL
jgi:D-3-phosphoglycerate dehydrogenase